ncbi:tRNA (uracil) methyltransferase [Ascoidea rubescens DSM 1968]|uniref:tRNA (uracil-O(2)-)-methyltransferase n=1 Tax=Ascoidea rubescens DSM 1968 TaxID=1344418 RepID=A0A1D2VDW8_9ASCO|nr:DUF1613-domain-containing protein [Ascoidea rubescens DSM 1968]ODV59782.1 DUF1613-domain-containing protein [Ascoidea rubescens DSM 1968]
MSSKDGDLINQAENKAAKKNFKNNSKRKSHVAGAEIPNIIDRQSILGLKWIGLFEEEVSFKFFHFEKAMLNLIKQPNINSTVILRADILKENNDKINEKPKIPLNFNNNNNNNNDNDNDNCSDNGILIKNLDDLEIKQVPLSLDFKPLYQIVRRIIPRNPFKDCIINQTCLMLILDDSKEFDQSLLIVYIPHIDNKLDCPFYLPAVNAIGILYHHGKLSIHYLPFDYLNENGLSIKEVKELLPVDRPIRTAYRLLQTAKKHSNGVMNGYQKRVTHDLIVPKVLFENRYIALKKKYSKYLVDNWAESTNPLKHVFEDISIAAFLIEFWSKIYKNKQEFEFRDLGCGNGILVYILLMEGYKGVGIDARKRKSWKLFPEKIQDKLKEKIIIPSVLLRPDPNIMKIRPDLKDNGKTFQVPIRSNELINNSLLSSGVPLYACYSSKYLLESSYVETCEYSKNTFIIGNHSDELSCWIPLLGYPFIVIPCCSYNLSGVRVRFQPSSFSIKNINFNKFTNSSSSTYSGLVEHIEYLSRSIGWKIEKEILRIPSTKNCAIIGTEKFKVEEIKKYQVDVKSIYEILMMEGGADGWVFSALNLIKSGTRNH